MPRGVPIRFCRKCGRQYEQGDVELWTLHYDDETRLSFWLCWRSACRATGEDRVRRQRFIKGVYVNRKIRQALARLTCAEFSLSVAQELVDVGLPVRTAWTLVEATLRAQRCAE